MIKKEINKLLNQTLEKIFKKKFNEEVSVPENPSFADLTSTVALKLAKEVKKNPLEIAQKIQKEMAGNFLFKKIEVIPPGFINFWIKKEYLFDQALKFIQKQWNFPSIYFGPNKKIMIEFAQPNTHKLFHIGHLRNVCIGESLARILEAVGNKVIRVNYQGDVGMHIAKCLWQLKNDKNKLKSAKTIKEKISLLGQAYALGNQAFEENEKARKEIIEINQQIYNKHPKIFSLWKKTRKWSLEYFDKIYQRLDTHFDRLYFESEMANQALEICKKAQEKGILEKSQEAIIFNGKKYGLDTRVFVNSLGYPTYEGKELALAEKEFSEFGEIDKCIHVVSVEQRSFFKVTFKVEELLDQQKYQGKQYHLAYEWVKLKTGKMSSREGNIIEANWLIDQVKERIIKKYQSSKKTAEILALAAIKYAFLKININVPLHFDIEESISLEGNSGPYLLYTFVRTQSVLKKSKKKKIKLENWVSDIKLTKEENNLLRIFLHFPNIVEESAKNLSPSILANFLYQLSKSFNLFYQKCRILEKDEKTQDLRILLTYATSTILQKGLYLLSIPTLKKM